MSISEKVHTRLPILLSSVVIFLLAFGAAVKLPFSAPEGDFGYNVLSYLQTGHVASTFLPDTYPFLMGVIYRWAGVHGVVAAQAVIYLLVAFCSFLFVRFFLRNDRLAAIGALAVALDPDLLSSISKLWDTLPTCFALLAFATLCLQLYRMPSRVLLLAFALGWGVSVSIRPNLAVLFLPLVFVLWPLGVKRCILNAASFALIGFAAYAASNTLAHGSFYVPSNGPYNLFAGANPYAENALLHGYNGEVGIDMALHALGVHFGNHHEPWLAAIYKSHAVLFITTHPGQWLWLMIIKLFTLLRPDLKSHSLGSPIGILKVLTSMCIPIWLLVLALSRRLLGRADLIVILVAAAYVMPFLLTNSDPRFRVPLDVLALAHTITLLLRRRERSTDRPARH